MRQDIQRRLAVDVPEQGQCVERERAMPSNILGDRRGGTGGRRKDEVPAEEDRGLVGVEREDTGGVGGERRAEQARAASVVRADAKRQSRLEVEAAGQDKQVRHEEGRPIRRQAGEADPSVRELPRPPAVLVERELERRPRILEERAQLSLPQRSQRCPGPK